METNIAVTLGVVVLLLLFAAAFALLRKRRADRLRSKFGPEYARTVEEVGGRQKAETQLHRRERRVRRFTIKPLTPSDRARYIPAWRELQAQFVDDPKQSVIGADQMLSEVMGDRGYPIGDFEQRFADLSVDHPISVQNYRAAHDTSVRQEPDQANTEDLRQAMLSYRALFDELVGEFPIVPDTVSSDPEELAANPDEIPETDTSMEPVLEVTSAEPPTAPALAHAVERR